MVMLLPKGILMLEHMVTKKFSRLDNIFCTSGLLARIVKCDTDLELRPSCTDHFPILTHLNLAQQRSPPSHSYNFQDTDWEAFWKTLLSNLASYRPPLPIRSETQLEGAADNLTKALKSIIESYVKRSQQRPDEKRWWNKELRAMRKELRKLRAVSYCNRALTEHPSHRELWKMSNSYGNEIQSAKKQHWMTYLEDMDANGI